MSFAQITLGDIAGAIAALAFAYLVWRLGSVIGKAGEILDETRIGVKGLADGSVPLLGEVTNTVASTNQHLAHVSANISALTSLIAATLGGPLVKVAAFTYGVRKAFAGQRTEPSPANPRGEHRG